MRRPASLLLACTLFGCAAPSRPAPEPSPAPSRTWVQRRLQAHWIEVEVGNGEKLRGWHVSLGECESLALHFLDGAIEDFPGGIDGLLEGMHDARMGTLVLDMRGVGASDGEWDTAHIPEDALAAWNEALRRVDGDAERVCVRGISRGTLAVASLIERGFEFSASMIAPVDGTEASIDVARAIRGSKWAPVVELAMADALLGQEAWDAVKVASAERGGLMRKAQGSRASIERLAARPLAWESELFGWRSHSVFRSLRTPGCILPHVEIIHPVPSFRGTTISVGAGK